MPRRAALWLMSFVNAGVFSLLSAAAALSARVSSGSNARGALIMSGFFAVAAIALVLYAQFWLLESQTTPGAPTVGPVLGVVRRVKDWSFMLVALSPLGCTIYLLTHPDW